MTEFESKYFTWEEVVSSQFAARHSLDNDPPDEILTNIRSTGIQADVMREYLGTPILVSSWYRSPKVNAGIGSKDTSDHPKGWCIDFTSPKFGSPSEVFMALRKAPFKFDQLILECGRWVHISFNPRYRGQVLGYAGNSYRLLEVIR